MFFNGYRVQLEFRDVVVRIHGVLVGKDEYGDLTASGCIKRPGGEEKSLLDGAGSVDHPGKLPVTRVEGQFQISLLRPGRKTSTGTGPHGQVDDQRGLEDTGQADPFSHEGQAPA